MVLQSIWQPLNGGGGGGGVPPLAQLPSWVCELHDPCDPSPPEMKWLPTSHWLPEQELFCCWFCCWMCSLTEQLPVVVH